MKVYLIRHCETDHNRDGLVQGRSDQPLNSHGCQQAMSLAARLGSIPIEAIYSSPLQRALDTARPIARLLDRAVIVEPSLVELDVGEMDGLTGQQMRERHPEFMQAWLAGIDGARPLPGGESLEDAQARAWSFIESIRDREGLENVACVTHYFVLLAVLARAIQLPLSNIKALRQSLGSFSVLDFRNGRVQINKLNETCHLIET